MAYTEFGTGDPQTRQAWSKVTFIEAIHRTFFRRLMGTNSDSFVYRLNELENDAGDRIRFDLLLQMQGYGVDGDSRAKGKGEALRYVQDNLYIDQKRLVHEFKRMSQQRTVHDLRQDARTALRDRWAVILDQFLWAYASGIAYGTLAANLPFAGNSLRTPDTNHVIDATGRNFDLDLVDYAKERARTVTPPLRPTLIDGRRTFAMVITPYQETNLKRQTEWREAQREAQVRSARNPIFTGALGVHNDVILFSSDYMPTFVVSPAHANNRSHALMIGAQGIALAFGNAFPRDMRGSAGGENFLRWEEETDDYGNERGVAAGIIFGVSKSQFSIDGTATDYGVIRVDTKDGPFSI